MILNGYLGNGLTWLLLITIWLFFGALTTLVFSLIAKAGRRSKRE